MRAEPNTTMVERMCHLASPASAVSKSWRSRSPRWPLPGQNSTHSASPFGSIFCTALSVTSFDPVEPCLPLRHGGGVGAAMAGLPGRDRLDLAVTVADRLLVGHRQLTEPRTDRLVGLAVIVAHRRLDDPAIGARLPHQFAVSRLREILRIEIVLFDELVQIRRLVGRVERLALVGLARDLVILIGEQRACQPGHAVIVLE